MMVFLLELKTKLTRIYGKYEAYITPLLKFLLALIAFVMINTNIGYMKSISRFPIACILAAVCAILPVNAMIAIAVLVILANLYALSLEVCLVGLILFMMIFLVYFRFAPKYGYNAVLMPICAKLGIPYIVPVSSGLLGEAYSVASVVCGTIVYYFLAGVHANETLLSKTAEKGETSKIEVALNQLLGNKEMYLVAMVLAIATLIVYIIRKMEIDNAWMIAWISGLLFETIGLIAGYMLLGMGSKIVGVVIGGIVSGALAILIQFLFFNFDYTRTERLQFEDDEYYYYVKAVPKAVIAGSDKQVKHFTKARDTEKERINKKKFAEEMEIDEELLK